MTKFFDAVSEAYFVPDGDDNVRFALSLYRGLALRLDKAEAEGIKILWTPLVRYYLIAAHACVMIGFVAPTVGLALLLALWLARFCLFEGIRRKFSKRLVSAGKHSELHRNLSRYVSRSFAISSQLLAILVIISSALYSRLATPEMYSLIEPAGFLCLALVALRWSIFLAAIMRSPRERQV